MANMSSLAMPRGSYGQYAIANNAFPHIEIVDMKTVILLDLIVKTNILGC